MRAAEERSGVSYEQAREGYDAAHEANRGDFQGTRDYQPYRPPPSSEYGVYEMDASSSNTGRYGEDQRYETGGGYGRPQQQDRPDEYKRDDYNRYQQAASQIGHHQGLGDGRWDSVSEVGDMLSSKLPSC